LWTFHHALLDGRSFPIVLREVFLCYEAIRDGREASLPAPRPYADYIAWLRTQDLGRAEAFWRSTLKGFSAPTPVPGHRATVGDVGAAPEGRGVHELQLASETTARLSAFAREHGVTLNTLVQAAWGLLLQRYSGESEVVFGVTRACRRSALDGAEDMVGLFINTLPVRVAVDGDARLGPWLRSLREGQVAVREFEHSPLARVQAWSDVPRGRALFESVVVFEGYLLDRILRADGGAWSNRHFEYIGQTSLPITLIAYAADELVVRLEHYRRVVNDETGARLLTHVRTLLEGMLKGADQRLGDLPLVVDEERESILARWRPGGVRRRVKTCIHQRFEAQVERSPDSVAVVFEGHALTYRELNRRANRLARRLRALGVGPESLVGLCVDRSLNIIVGILGILKAGGAYVPLDPAYPRDRLAFMLEDSAVPVLVVERALQSSLPPHRADVVPVDDREALAAGSAEDDGSAPTATQPGNLAYVIYTSGSTGRPKGVLVTHDNVIRLMDATEPWFGFGPHDVWTLFHSYAFDFSVWEIWGALFYGGRLVVVPYWVSRSPETFYELLSTEGITVLNQTPSAFRQLVSAVLSGPPRSLALRTVIFGGEALELASLRPWFDRFGDARPRLVNMYGITETTVHVTYRPISAEDARAGTGSVIGRPIPDLSVYLLDSHGQLVPVGVPGEIHVGGAGVARGYLNRPELTAQRFVADPFASGAEARLYRSGDLARNLPNGDLEYLGRIDHQVKVRGFRIELGEIESVLAQHPAVREAVVIVREDRPGDRRLVAYYVADPEAHGLGDDLRSRARAALPEYMVPSALVGLDALPLTSNGKVDRRALPPPLDAELESGREYVAPRGAAEQALAQIWASVLGVPRVGINDNFFELGGDSILMIQVIARARQLSLALSPRDLFKHPTVAELAPLTGIGAAAVSAPGPDAGRVVLSPIQQWFFEQRLPAAHHWNQAFVFETAADVEGEYLERAIEAVASQHDAFRLRFRRDGDEWIQDHAPAGASLVRVTRVTASAASDDARRSAIAEAARLAHEGLDLDRGPLLAAVVVSFAGGGSGRLVLAAHHLVIDGVSWRVLMEDLEAAYRDLRDGRAVRHAAPTTSFTSWMARLVSAAGAGAFAAERDHWRQLGACGELPFDHPCAGAGTEASARSVVVRLDRGRTAALLQGAPEAFRTQINEVLLASLVRALTAWTGRSSVVIALEGHGREPLFDGVDLSRTMGWFTSLFPVRLDVDPARSTLATLRRVKETLRAVPSRGVGYGVLRYLGADPELATQPEPHLAFNYLGQLDQILVGSSLFRFAAEDSGPWHGADNPRPHRLEVLCMVRGGELETHWIYSADVHDRSTIERVAHGFLAGLQELAAAVAAPTPAAWTPSDFPLAGLDEAGLAGILADVPDADDLYPLAPMQELFLSMDPAGKSLGLEQWEFELRGPLDVGALHRAWDDVIQRHPVLRTAFVGHGPGQPLQVVLRSAPVEWTVADWAALAPTEREARLERFLAADQARGLDPRWAPLARVSVIRTAADTHRMVWTTHHLHVDGWSWPLIFRDLAAAYEARRQGRAPDLDRACPYRRFIAWRLERRDADDEAYWRRRLEGVTAPTPVPLGHAPGGVPTEERVFDVRTTRLSTASSDALRALARSRQVTLGTIVQGAWALVLHRAAGTDDVVFGAAFAGRPPEVPNVESMVGPCVNNVPVRVRIAPEESLGTWLSRLQIEQADTTAHQYSSPARIQEWTRVPWRRRLFESLLVFQNYSSGEELERLGPTITLRALAVPETTNYALTVMVLPGPELEVRLIFRRHHADGVAVDRTLESLRGVLEAMAEFPHRTVGELASLVARPPTGPAMPMPTRATAGGREALARHTQLEEVIAGIWAELFEVEEVGLDQNFFELGGQSVLLVQTHARLRERLGIELPIVTLFQYPTVSSLAAFLAHGASGGPADSAGHGGMSRPRGVLAPVETSVSESHRDPHTHEGVAIVGMVGRFPGAGSIDQFWRNLVAGKETISRFAPEELEPSRLEPRDARGTPNYVRARGVLEGVDQFDAAFFGINPAEAVVMDPQQRLFLEAAWEALEVAGYNPAAFPGAIGVWAGMSNNTYFPECVQGRQDLIDRVGTLQAMMANEKDYLATRVSYKLNLRGPSVSVYTACSTSLVAVCQAVQGLLTRQCDMALAGGISISVPQHRGYIYQEGAISSPDGHCRSFDSAAQGTVFSNGLGIVVLKRLQDALADGDTIHAVIKGAALNNDGSGKVSFTAPSVDGQAEVIAMAQGLAGFPPESISYVEAHGTATPLGDPVEIAALTKAFRGKTDARGFCALGSVKSNIGHLDAAAGVAGLVKTVLALRHRMLPPSLHFATPNPKLDLASSPFVVNATLRQWPDGPTPRRAGVSSFGVGGTNAHVVLEEAPGAAPPPSTRPEQLLIVSARSAAALDEACRRLARYLAATPDIELADVAWTLQVGRKTFPYRRAVVGASREETMAALSHRDATRPIVEHRERAETAVTFMFPGQGAQHVDMMAGLYRREPCFAAELDAAAAALVPLLGVDIRGLLFPNANVRDEAARRLDETAITQPVLFAVEYALAQMWLSWGVTPTAMIGHSLGEYVAACLAGTLSRDQALELVAGRARLMQAQPRGAMLAVRLPGVETEALLEDGLSIAALNGPTLTVVSGPVESIESLQARLHARDVASRIVPTSHAFHSSMMDGALLPFRELVGRVRLAAPRVPWVSCVTGSWVTAEQATDPEYWVEQLRRPVRFSDGLRLLAKEPNQVLLEVGPGHTLTTLARQQLDRGVGPAAVTSLGAKPSADVSSMLDALGQLWIAGARLDWAALHGAPRRRIPLPTYPFERKRFWIDPEPPATAHDTSVATTLCSPGDEASVSVRPALAPTATYEDPHMTQSTDRAISTPGRRADLIGRLATLFSELSGLPTSDLQPTVPFLELGFDSLFLTQASTAVQKKFGVRITFRQLLEDLATLETLANHLDATLPPEAARASTVAAPVPPAARETGAGHPATAEPSRPSPAMRVPSGLEPGEGGSSLERIVSRQLELMAQQLQMLRNGGADDHETHELAAPAEAWAPAAPAAPTASGDPPRSAAPPARSDVKAFGPYRPIDKGPGGGLTTQQQAALASLVQRYNERTRTSKRLTEEHRPHLADPRSVAGFRLAWKEIVYPIVTVGSAGSKLWDADGNEYVDITNGFGMILLGHSPAFLRAALDEQLRSGIEIGPQSPLTGEVARLVCDFTGMERAAFCNTGSEAVSAAVRVARTVTGRDKIAVFAGAYHGIFDEVLVRGGAAGAAPRAYPIAPGIPPSAVDQVLVLEYGSPEAVSTLRTRAHELAAILVEPVQSRRPELQPREFLQEVRAIASERGTALVFDEVVTGFRVHPGGAQAVFDVQADLATYGKVIGGGLPIGIVAGRRHFMDALDGGAWQYGDESFPEVGVTFFAGTFVRHPLALAAARACLTHLREQGPELQRGLNRRTTELVETLNAQSASLAAPVRITHFSSWFCINFPADVPHASLFFAHMRLRGIHIWEGRPCFLTTAHTEDDLARVVRAFKESVEEMQRGGFLPGAPPASPPVPGARQGRDGNGQSAWFVPDPDRPGKYLQVMEKSR
jgi:amino acid adenylation domain-containing protein/non-ribosomal peptide synthase protein (TIGR01720 family)